MDNNLPNPEDLTDEQLDALLTTGQIPDAEEEDKDKDKSTDKLNPDDKQDDDQGKGDEDEDKSDEEDEDQDDEDDESEDEDQDKSKKTEDEDKSKKPSRREQARVQDLLKKYGNPEDKSKTPTSKGMDYEKELEASPEMIEKLSKDRESVAKASYKEGLEQMNSLQFTTRLEIDAPRVEQKYPILDRNSDKFKPEAATDFNLLYLHFAGYDKETRRVANPEVRYGEFADVIFGLANELADTRVEEQVKEVKKQAAKTGLRPDGSRAKKLDLTKAPEDMTDEELDAYLKKAIPQR